ncbi:DUF4294 domain-containing protein [Paenimyroides tangerinum]|nr:DUF4294 domain-containing protein [Paenimyroides tangerinum]
MKQLFFIFILIFFSQKITAQVNDWQKYADTLSTVVNEDGEIETEYMLTEMNINFTKEELERMKANSILRRRILRVYPYVVATSEALTTVNENLAKFKTNREKRKYINASQDYLESQFKDKLKSLSRKDGQILVKLIDRQTGQTTFSLIKEFKSGWKAFWSNQTAKLFDINLKTKFDPDTTLEDFYIERILLELQEEGKINYYPPKKKYNINNLNQIWKAKLGDSGYFPE